MSTFGWLWYKSKEEKNSIDKYENTVGNFVHGAASEGAFTCNYFPAQSSIWCMWFTDKSAVDVLQHLPANCEDEWCRVN